MSIPETIREVLIITQLGHPLAHLGVMLGEGVGVRVGFTDREPDQVTNAGDAGYKFLVGFEV